jgi:hypothetical protein
VGEFWKNGHGVSLVVGILSVTGVITTGIIAHAGSEAQRITSDDGARAQREFAKQIAHGQLESAERIANAERQTKLLEIFSRQLTSPSSGDRVLAVNILRSLDSELSLRLAEAVLSDVTQPQAVKDAAKAVVTQAEERQDLLSKVQPSLECKVVGPELWSVHLSLRGTQGKSIQSVRYALLGGWRVTSNAAEQFPADFRVRQCAIAQIAVTSSAGTDRIPFDLCSSPEWTQCSKK